MLVRRAEKKDINKIMVLLEQVALIHHELRPDIFNIGTKYTEPQLIEIINDENRPILVADDNGNIKGYAFCMYKTNEKDNILTNIKSLYLDDLCVDENYRGEHIGELLYNSVLQLAKDKGCYNVTLNVWSENKSAIKFYEKCGLKPLKVCMEKLID